MKFLNELLNIAEDIQPRSQGWYIKQKRANKSVFVGGPMSEDAAIKQVEQRGGSEKGFSKTFVSAYDAKASKTNQSGT
jgi:hypothetical protein